MSLQEEIKSARKTIVTDGYDMSIGELINLYKNHELKIDPAFQRLFRWDDGRKTRFIESILLGIPFPPIFVYQDENGVWELIDGLQRVSTILQFTADLKGERSDILGPLILNGTRHLPSLNGKRWQPSSEESDDGIGQALQIEIKRARVRVEILKSDSHSSAKFELFQRLNTGGTRLTEQEVRNSIAVSLNRRFYEWLNACANYPAFITTTAQTETAIEAQAGVELAFRFFAFNKIPYKNALDVHEYLDDALLQIATDPDFDLDYNSSVFKRTFDHLNAALGENAFKRWNGSTFTGRFLMSVYEVMATGVSKNIQLIDNLDVTQRNSFIVSASKSLWNNENFTPYSGAGVRGTTRLAKLLPLAASVLNPSDFA